MTGQTPAPPSPLIDPMFDLETTPRVVLLGNGWVDRRLGLDFSLERDRDGEAYSYFNLYKLCSGHPLALALCSIRRISPLGWTPYLEIARYEVSREKLCAQLDRRSTAHFARQLEAGLDDHEPQHRDDIREMIANHRRWGKEREEVRQFVDTIGGRDAFIELCLKAIRACHVVNSPWNEVWQSAQEVELDLVD